MWFNRARLQHSKVGLAVGVVLYLFVFNLVTAGDLRGSLFYGIWPAAVTLLLLAVLAVVHRHVLKAAAMLLILIASTALFFKYKYGIIISEDIVLSAWINDVSLSLEMLSSNLVIWLALTAILPMLYIAWAPIKAASWPRQLFQATLTGLLALAVIAAVFHLQGFELGQRGHIRDPQIANSLPFFSPVDAIYAAHSARKAQKNYRKNYANVVRLSQQYKYTMAPDLQDLFVLVIVGETARGDRFSLNGYARNTNPRLSSIENLYSFANFSSCDTITIRAMKCIFSRVNAATRSQPINESAFTDVFKSLGFGVDIYSLQGMTDIYNYLGYDKLVSKYAVLKNSQIGAKDAAMLPLLATALAKQQGNQLVVMHTLGSHQTYHDRTTPDQQMFQPICSNADVQACPLDALNNAYDNTIVATDAFIHAATQMLRGRKAVLLYVSDHGESLGEGGIYYHGLPADVAPRQQFHVPMLVWLSPPLLETPSGRSMATQLSGLNKAGAYSHDNFFHSVLGCAGISSSDGGMDSGLNLCGPALVAPP